ncbi:Inner membrane transport permease YbhR [Pseudobythopirellula maris]|uniref:Transport permease protein n=1 Tax=Pseudobythopirellula maris TaxID=2527991 RepID=A0A5C5ZJQ9_9BACT|nr:ABC transporter permease [Pseudobythopirellula maris]TWT87277.1 Inner membrane transport permease YbhR [Pseudobythopirellula maris]
MTNTVPALPVVVALAERELVRFFRQRNRVIGGLVQPVLFWLLFSEGFRQRDLGYAHFFPGTLAMILLFTAIFATISIIEDRNEGFLQGVLVAPTPRWAMVLGKLLGGSAIAMIQALLFLALGWARVPEITPTVPYALLAVVMMTLVSIALTGLGFLIAWRMDSTQGFHAIMSVFLLPMWLLSGALFPQGADGLLGWVVAVNPLTYGVTGLRRYLEIGDAVTSPSAAVEGLPPLWLCWLVTGVFAAVMLAACTWIAGTRTRSDYK